MQDVCFAPICECLYISSVELDKRLHCQTYNLYRTSYNDFKENWARFPRCFTTYQELFGLLPGNTECSSGFLGFCPWLPSWVFLHWSSSPPIKRFYSWLKILIFSEKTDLIYWLTTSTPGLCKSTNFVVTDQLQQGTTSNAQKSYRI